MNAATTKLRASIPRVACRNYFAVPGMITISSEGSRNPSAFSATEQKASWVHYKHEDGLDPYRWTAKECHHVLEDRPWQEVLKFYSHVAAGNLSLSDLTFFGNFHDADSQRDVSERDQMLSVYATAPSEDSHIVSLKTLKGGKWDRKTFKIVVSYDGSAFTGWQRQPGLHTVQGLLEQALGNYCDGKRVASLKSEGLSADAMVVVAGRTDKGVHAAGQVCSFYTWRSGVCPEDIRTGINSLDPKALRAISVNEVSRTFHPNFSAKWRRYVYILPLHSYDISDQSWLQAVSAELRSFVKPKTFDVRAVNKMLAQLEGQQLSFTVFARDTKISRSRGPPTECYIYHARAAVAELPLMEQGSEQRSQVLCVELVANRFLRKMVRVLVATSIREAAAGASSDSLVRLTRASCRRASAPPAPACGLCLSEVGYEDFSHSNLLIK
ncbi:hypothetical protein GOP47_0015683 [Adiantum capillus-veneris]|uniref:tRNA pseudouridine synthase n=1 Tax=Adiantum capillus-veneris TaxID=13818 RepID=A0A9D4ZCU9_ADICA|nr:hypothetical protein GOP47_0015683 [Adiantum capillus-veneris]